MARRGHREWSLSGFRVSFNIHTYGILRKTVYFAHEPIHESPGFVKLSLTTWAWNQFSCLTQHLNNDPKRSTWAALQHKDKTCLWEMSFLRDCIGTSPVVLLILEISKSRVGFILVRQKILLGFILFSFVAFLITTKNHLSFCTKIPHSPVLQHE